MPNIKRANRRERKRASLEKGRRMRGNRSVFEIQKAIKGRSKNVKRDHRCLVAPQDTAARASNVACRYAPRTGASQCDTVAHADPG